MTDPLRLVGDIGGTNARFALASAEAPGYRHERVFSCADFPSLEDSIRCFVEQADITMPKVMCLAVAGPVTDGRVQLTNNRWQIDERHLAAAFSLEAVSLLNDFAAIALSIPALRSEDLLRIGPASLDLGSPGRRCVGVIGPGTGLGGAGLVMSGPEKALLVTEAGHVGFAPNSPLQVELHRVLSRRFGRVSNERLVSGPGLENLYEALREIDGLGRSHLRAGEIFQAASTAADELALRAVDLFFEIFGQVAGDFALGLGAFDGVCLAGGVIQRHARLLQQSRFRQAFEDKSRLRPRLERTATVLVTHPQPGLLGASELARAL